MKFVSILALAAAVFAPRAVAQGDAFDPQEQGNIVHTTLEQVRAQPDAFKGVSVQFPVQFCSIGKISNPFFTRFVPSHYTNFYAWGAEQPIWRRHEYDNVCGTFFLSKTAEQLDEIYQLGLYDRVNVTGVVRNTFQSKPWIEVTSFTRMPKKVDTPTLAHMFRGETHMHQRQWNRAVSELSLASAGNVPNEINLAVNADLGLCYLRVGEIGAAMTHLSQAMRLSNGNPSPELEALYLTASSNPEAQLDRHIEAVEVLEHQRPMWEAFETAVAVQR